MTEEAQEQVIENQEGQDGIDKREPSDGIGVSEEVGEVEQAGTSNSKPDEIVRIETETSQQPKKDRSAAGRIKELNNKVKDRDVVIDKIKQEKQELEERLKAYDALKKPDAEKYEDDDEYEIDRTAYVQQKASAKIEREKLEALEAREAQEVDYAYKASSQDFYQKLDQAQDETKEFIRQNARQHKPRSKQIEMEIMDSPYAAEIFEVILQDVNKFNSLSDTRFVKEVAKIEAKFENANKPLKAPISVPNPPTSLDTGNIGGDAKKNNVPEWARFSFKQARNMR